MARRRGLWCLYARGDGRDHLGGLAECSLATLDPVAPRNPGEVRVCGPHGAALVLEDEQPDRPVETRQRICGDELRAQRRIAEYQQRGWAHCDSRLRRERRL